LSVSGAVASAEDRLDILELLARADDAASRRDVTTYVALFSDDASLEGDKGTHRGKDALRSIVAEVWESEGTATRHLTLNSVLQPIAGNPAAVLATSTLLIVAPGAPPQLQSVSAISQLVVKIDGGWRIARRTVHLL
jgi:ketosteroid isomerase-like protein